MYRASPFWFLALLLATLPAFWVTYFFPRRYETDWHVHLHGLVMFLWLLLLLTQATLARFHAYGWHRALGRSSYGLVPLVVVSTLLLAHYRMRQGLNAELVYFFAVQVGLLVQFVIAYGGAMLNRRTPAVHARFMACTGLALVDPILARVLAIHFGVEPPLLQVMTYGFIDLLLVALILRDRLHATYTHVYQGMLLVFVVTQAPTFFAAESKPWLALTQAFARLPLP
jgi:hypothetical protein